MSAWNPSLPLWSTGLAISIALAAALLTRAPLGPALEQSGTGWVFYLGLAVVYPAAALALLRGGRLAARARTVLAVIGAVSMVLFVVLAQRWLAIPFAALTLAIGWPRLRRSPAVRHPADVAFVVLFVVTTWSAAIGLAFFTPLTDWLAGRTPYANAAQALVVFAGAAVLAAAAIFDRVPLVRRAAIDRAALALTAAAIVLAALRRDHAVGDVMHVAFYVGPIELVRQGGWLLWDVPSQYGFGMVLANAALPIASSYAALAVLNGALLAAAAAIVFALLRAGTKGPLQTLFAGLTAVAAVFFVCGKYWEIIGAEHYPSIGPMRFIGCYVLVALTVAEYSGRLSVPRTLIAGCAVYAAAFWWSAESAVYSSCIWLPALTALTWRTGGLRGALRWAAVAAGAVISGAAAIAVVYAVGLHRLPDWYAFVEYGLAYRGGASFVPMTVLGAVWVLVLTFVVCTAVTLAIVQQRRARALPALLAACGAQWSTMSYFITRSHDNNVCNLIPLEIAVLAVVLYALRREALDDATAVFTRCAAVPIAAMTIGLAFSPSGVVPRYLEPLAGPRTPVQAFPPIPPDLAAQLAAAGAGPGAAVLYENRYVPPVWPSAPDLLPRLWAPYAPPAELGVLSPERQEVYVRRFAQRRPMAGFLVEEHAAPLLPGAPPMREVLGSAYAETLAATSAAYTIYRYDPR